LFWGILRIFCNCVFDCSHLFLIIDSIKNVGTGPIPLYVLAHRSLIKEP
jgi:hypothetical protein